MADESNRAQEIFLAAIELYAPEEWPGFLDEICAEEPAVRGRVERLLRAHAKLGTFHEEMKPTPPATLDEQLNEGPGTLIGPYKLLEQIGEGGMGLVFMAEQSHPVRRRVALKVIKPGMDTCQVVARFEAERQTLALMDHPNIARVIDGGQTASDRPYFVMELVKGVPITDYCDHNQVPIRQRLELFMSVCQAVQHAHQKGIIHRDIKPSNVLVMSHDGAPVVKVIDFGVAKAIGQQLTDKTIYTQFTQLIGTPLYMSPEQAGQSSLDVDTRSDIYSLGVLLYELLTSTTPFDEKRLREVGYDEMRQIIREQEPARPSTRISTLGQAAITVSMQRQSDPKQLSRLFRGELDWIVMKALEKDRNRRYETANGFATEVQRYLNDEPVLACPPSAAYRFRKFARRNKAALGVATAVTAAVVLAVASLVGAVKVLAASNAQIKAEQYQTKEALDAESQAKDNLLRALEREEQTLYFRRIGLVERELAIGTVGRAEELLDECPLPLRGWEWHYLKRRRYREPLTFRGHKAHVLTTAFSPDGKYVASASSLLSYTVGEIKIWHRTTGKVDHNLLGHVGPVSGVAFSPQGKRVVSAGWDRTLKVWDVATGKLVRTLTGHSEYLSCVAWSADGKFLASGGGDRTVRIWDANSFQELRTLRGHGRALFALAFSPDGKAVASASADLTVRVWDVADGRELHVLAGHKGPVLGVAFRRDGRCIASASLDGTVKLWNAQSGQHHLTIRPATAVVTSVAFSPDGQRLATGSWEKTIKVWDLASNKEAITLHGHDDLVSSVVFSPDGLQLASSSMDGTVKVWDGTPVGGKLGPEALTLRGHDDVVLGVAFRPETNQLATASFDQTVRFWNASTGEEVLILRGHPGPIAGLVFSRDGRRLASTDYAGVAVIWDVATGKEIHRFHNFGGSVTFSPDGQRLAFTLEGGTIQILDAVTGKDVLPAFRGHAAPIACVAFSPDGRRLATASWDGATKVWDVETGRQLHALRGHRNALHSVAFSADGKRLATASWDKTQRVWDVETGKELVTLLGHEDRVLSVAFSPDGRHLATASWDQTVKIWDARTGKELATLRGHAGYVSSVAFSPDGKRLASASGYRGKGEVKIWDAKWGDEKANGP